MPRSSLMKSLLLFVILFIATTAFIRADEVPLSACATPESFDELVTWINKVDTQVLKSKNKPPAKDDYVSSLGFVVRGSCFAGKRAEKKQEIIKKFENALAFVLQQTSRCYKNFGFPQLVSVPSLLKTIEFICAESNEEHGARAHVRPDQTLVRVPTHKLFDYTDFHANSLGLRRVEINIKNNQDLTETTETYAGLLFHELLHFTPSHNRAWHESAQRRPENCTESIFADRIYFLQSACFPLADYGLRFWGGWINEGAAEGKEKWKLPSAILDCKNLCERGLGETDSMESILKTSPWMKNIYKTNNLVVGKPLPRQYIKTTCASIHEAAVFRKKYQLDREELANFRFVQKVKPLIKDYRLKYGFQRYVDIVYHPFPREQKLRELTALKNELARDVADHCSRNSESCAAGSGPLQYILDRGYALVKNMTPKQAQILELSFRRADDLK